MNDFEDFEFRCYRCGSQMACIQHCYSITRTFEQTLTCDCADGAELAGLLRYSQSKNWEESGHLEEGRFIRDGRCLLDRLPREILERQLRCQDCCETAADLDWETEQLGEAEIVEGPDAWMMYCHHCKTEAQFGWTEPDRQGFLVPVSNFSDVHHIWVDPGFQYRQESTQNLATRRTRKSRPAIERRRR